jgi:hypothetical protein
MGTNAGPGLANIYLYDYEAKFIDRLCAEGKIEIAKQFHSSFRYIDDTISIDNDSWREYTDKPAEEGGIYPACLTYNATRLSATATRFLGMHIHIRDSGNCVISSFDKRHEFGFTIQHYPDMRSMIPESLPYGTFTGLLHRYYRLCTEACNFVDISAELAVKMIMKGCSRTKLHRIFRSFLMSHVPLRWFRVRRKTEWLLVRFSRTARAQQCEPSRLNE